MGYKWHVVSFANHESKTHSLSGRDFLLPNGVWPDGASFAFQTSGVDSRSGGVATCGSGVPAKSGGVTIRSGGADIRFSGAPFRNSGITKRDSGDPIQTSGVRFRFSGVSLPMRGVPRKTGGFALKSAKSTDLQRKPVLAWTAATCRRFPGADMSARSRPFAAIPSFQLPTPNSQ